MSFEKRKAIFNSKLKKNTVNGCWGKICFNSFGLFILIILDILIGSNINLLKDMFYFTEIDYHIKLLKSILTFSELFLIVSISLEARRMIEETGMRKKQFEINKKELPEAFSVFMSNKNNKNLKNVLIDFLKKSNEEEIELILKKGDKNTKKGIEILKEESKSIIKEEIKKLEKEKNKISKEISKIERTYSLNKIKHKIKNE